MSGYRSSVRGKLLNAYSYLCGYDTFRTLNGFLLECGARGLGVNNPISIAMEVQQIVDVLSATSSPVIFDVGANCGDYAVEILQVIPDARLYAFEPNPKIFNDLSKKAEKYNFISYNKACGKIAGSALLYDLAKESGGGTHASLYQKVITDLHKSKAHSVKADVTTIDEVFDEIGIDQIDLLKIDVEGAEYDVLCGAKLRLSEGRIKAVLFEFNEMNVVSRVYLQDFFLILPEFDFFRLGTKGLIPILRESSMLFHELVGYQNIIAIKCPKRH